MARASGAGDVLTHPLDATPAKPIEIDTERLLRWGGVALVVLAVVFGVSTAVSRGWIGRELQLAGALVLSAALVAAGVWLRDQAPGWRHALCGAGVIAAHVTVASPLLLDLAPDTVAMVATVIVACGGLALAMFVDSPWVAAAAAVAGTGGWYASAGGDPPVGATSAWVAIVVAASVVLATARRWYGVRAVALMVGFAFLPFTADEASGRADQVVVAIVALALVGAWCSVPSLGEMGHGWRDAEIQLAMIVAPWALMMTAILFDLDDDTQAGWTAFAIGAVVGGVALIGRRWLVEAHVVSLAVSASLAVSIGVGLLFEQRVLALCFAVQGAGLLVLERRLHNNLRIRINGIALLALAAMILLGRLVEAWTEDQPAGADVAHTLALVVIGTAAAIELDWFLRRALAVATLALLLIWFGSVFVHLPQGQAIVSVCWAVVGTALLVVGATRKIPAAGQAGLVVLGLTVAKLLTVDLNEVDTLWRAGLFLLIGLAFLRLGFLLPKIVGRAGDAPPGPDVPPELEDGPDVQPASTSSSRS